MHPLLESYPDELARWLDDHLQPAYRRRQIDRWMFQRRAESFAAMTDLPQSLRDALQSQFRFWSSDLVRHTQAADGTEKLLLRFADGGMIECVLLRDGHRRTICISTQVGCAMGCVFCASGLDGVKRNLTSAEILEQMLRLQRLLPVDERLSHIVVMGMGEPLANLDQLLPALAWANATDGLDISARRITISTVGLPTAIDRLVAMRVPYHLAVSLHAPNDELRNELVPINRKIGLDAVLAASDRYFAANGRRLTFEYVLLGELNDSEVHARELARRLQGRTALLNVIPYNSVPGLPYQTPSPERTERFLATLTQRGIAVQVRQRKGDEIQAACGQLKRSTEVEAAELFALAGVRVSAARDRAAAPLPEAPECRGPADTAGDFRTDR